MGFLSERRYRYLSHSPAVEALLKEAFRKAIHLCAAFVPLLAQVNVKATCVLLALAIVVYSLCEALRLRGANVPFVSKITAYAARERDKGRFVLGPVTLAAGILLALLLFPLRYATAGILALAFGDGTASLAGKLFGRHRLPGNISKTVEGGAACFAAVFISSLAVTGKASHALYLALAAAVFEALPLKDWDNLIIPLLISFLAALLDSFALF